MQVYELIEMLEQYDGEQEVRLAFQPNWPLAFEIGNVVSQDEFEAEIDEDSFDGYHARCENFGIGSGYCVPCGEHEEGVGPDHDTRHLDGQDEEQPIVWITEGGHPSDSPYAPRDAFSSY